MNLASALPSAHLSAPPGLVVELEHVFECFTGSGSKLICTVVRRDVQFKQRQTGGANGWLFISKHGCHEQHDLKGLFTAFPCCLQGVSAALPGAGSC